LALGYIKLGRMNAHSTLPPFPDALAASLGQLMVRFQALESTLIFAVGRFMHPGNDDIPPQLTLSVLYELPFSSLVKLFATIPLTLTGPSLPFSRLKENTDEAKQLVADFASAAKLCTAAEERRNQLMHSNWLQLHIGPGEESVMRVKMRATRKSGAAAPLIRESVDTVSADIDAINEAMTATFTASAGLKFFLFPGAEDAA
jgi:hypothetical protein